jgi:hypothetical protein
MNSRSKLVNSKGFLILSLVSKNVEREKKVDEEFQADNMDIFRAPAINQEIVNIIGTDDCRF